MLPQILIYNPRLGVDKLILKNIATVASSIHTGYLITIIYLFFIFYYIFFFFFFSAISDFLFSYKLLKFNLKN